MALWRYICQHISGSALAQEMACCLMAPSHCLKSYWVILSSDIYLRAISREIPQPSITKISLENYLTKISFKSPRGQFVNYLSLPDAQARLRWTWLGPWASAARRWSLPPYQEKPAANAQVRTAWINNYIHFWSVRWNYLSIPKLQRLHRWSLGMDK